MIRMKCFEFTIGKWPTDNAAVIASFILSSTRASSLITLAVRFNLVTSRSPCDLTHAARHLQSLTPGLNLWKGSFGDNDRGAADEGLVSAGGFA